jgi:hypothetical protein
MSWDFDLCDSVTGDVLSVEEKHQIKGGTYCVGGTNALTLNVTYNYSDIIDKVFPCTDEYAHCMNNLSGAESIPLLKEAISKLGNDVDDDYWSATEGNAKRALNGLLAFAQMRPDGVWHVY